jgi:hypothetical protein
LQHPGNPYYSRGYLSKSLEKSWWLFHSDTRLYQALCLYGILVMAMKRTKVKKVPIRRAESS